ncbi:MAG: hypothetical protein ACREDX_05220 [Aestuariivirga sp.]
MGSSVALLGIMGAATCAMASTARLTIPFLAGFLAAVLRRAAFTGLRAGFRVDLVLRLEVLAAFLAPAFFFVGFLALRAINCSFALFASPHTDH